MPRLHQCLSYCDSFKLLVCSDDDPSLTFDLFTQMGNIGLDVRFIAESDAFLFAVDYVSLPQKMVLLAHVSYQSILPYQYVDDKVKITLFPFVY